MGSQESPALPLYPHAPMPTAPPHLYLPSGRYHPGPGGHVVAFELLLTLLQELAAADWRLAHALARQQHDTAAAAAAGGGEAQHLAAAEAELRAEFEAEAARPLPAPLGAENWEPERGSSCLIQQE